MLRFTGVMKLSHRVRSGVELFASNHTTQHHCEKYDPDRDTNNFEHVTPRHQSLYDWSSDRGRAFKTSALWETFRWSNHSVAFALRGATGSIWEQLETLSRQRETGTRTKPEGARNPILWAYF
jgi:hypothetical protein